MILEFIILSFFIICAIPFIVSLKRGRFDIFEPIIIHAVFMVMFGFAFVERLYLSEPSIRYSNLVSWAPNVALIIGLTLHLVFFIAVIIGYYLNINNYVQVPQFYNKDHSHNTIILRKFSYIYLIIGTIFYIIIIYYIFNGDLLLVLTDTTPRSEVFRGSVASLLKLGLNFLNIGYMIWLALLINQDIKPRARHLLLLIPIVSVFITLGGAGGAFGVAIGVIIFLYYSVYLFNLCKISNQGLEFSSDQLHFYFKMGFIPLFGIILGIGAILLRSIRGGKSFSQVMGDIGIFQFLTAGIPNDVIDNLIVLLEIVPHEVSYQWGLHIFRVPLNWIPRSIWSDKPVLTAGSMLRRVILPDASGGRSPGQVGRWYFDFGYPGIIIGGLITGLVLRLLYELLRKNGHSVIFLIIYSTIIFSIAKGLTNNTLWGTMVTLMLFSPVVLYDWKYSKGND